MNPHDIKPLDFATAIDLLHIERKELAEAIALLRELNDELVLPAELQAKMDALLDKADAK